MPSDCIPFRETNYFSNLICDYLDENAELCQFYNRFPKLNAFGDQIDEKKENYNHTFRVTLSKVIRSQYEGLSCSKLTLGNIDSLQEENTFTVTTGHQLNLFTGPLYFLYKISSVINLAKQLKKEYPSYNVIPVYWMATEDHDFEEINYFNFQGRKVQWSKEASGPVGRLSTNGLDQVLEVFSNVIGKSENAQELISLFRQAYVDHDNLADATRYLANALFGDQGLVIVDGDNADLKQMFSPYVKRELFEQLAFKEVSDTSAKLAELSHKVQVNPRDINLFYIEDGLRERIVYENDMFGVLNTTIRWNKDELIQLLESHPERFSPNALLRPLFQEVILPNLCYTGGGGELAYWFQLKAYFKSVGITFPMLLLRNSVLITTAKQATKLEKLGLSMADLFDKQEDLRSNQTKRLSEIDIDFSNQRAFLKDQFKALYKLAEQTDKSFVGAVAAQEKKQLKGIDNLEGRLLRAQKRKLAETLDRITTLQDELFPRQSLQERNTNFSEFYLEYGKSLVNILLDELDPLIGEFSIIEF